MVLSKAVMLFAAFVRVEFAVSNAVEVASTVVPTKSRVLVRLVVNGSLTIHTATIPPTLKISPAMAAIIMAMAIIRVNHV